MPNTVKLSIYKYSPSKQDYLKYWSLVVLANGNIMTHCEMEQCGGREDIVSQCTLLLHEHCENVNNNTQLLLC